MANQSYTTSFLVEASPKQVFDAINNPRGWWSQAIEGDTDKLGAVFWYHYKAVHRCTFKITELVPGERVAWHVLDNYFDFVKDQSEWVGTDVLFELAQKGSQTEVRFTHRGLMPAHECFSVCSDAWRTYVNDSLRNLITKGKGAPNPIEEVVSRAQDMKRQARAN